MIQRKRIPFFKALQMLGGYARTRIMEQLKSIAFIVLYLIVFQTLILGVPLANAWGTAGGMALVIFGLAFFLEGLILGLMPLGERLGVKLPTRVGIIFIAIFGLILGFGATLAEPAISALKAAGSSITAWDSPLLFILLNKYTTTLIISVGIGVGIAVALGMFRFYYNWSIKPLIFILIPTALLLSLYAAFDDNLTKIIGLAWDCGAVTTGAVTVPLVLALGIGVSRAASKGKGSSGGFGIILLASIFPVIAVLTLGIFLNFNAPNSTTEKEFFSIANREKAMQAFDNEEQLLQHAFTHGTEEGRKAYFPKSENYTNKLLALTNDKKIRGELLGNLPYHSWLVSNASENERNFLIDKEALEDEDMTVPLSTVLKEEGIGGMRAVIPLTYLLLIVLVILLREKIRYKDEVTTGIIFTLIGMIMLTAGIRLGLASLGGEVGSQLPRAFAEEDKYIDRVMINDFDTSLVYKAVALEGNTKSYFNLIEGEKVNRTEFFADRYNNETGQYEHIITQKPLFGKSLSILGLILVLLFAFGMGYGATLAEPALNALGMTVEGLTAGAMKRTTIVQVVSIGVGIGILLGIARILFDLPLIWLIIPTYVILIPLTYFSEEEFTAIAWDSGGVTTGPVTVPLVLAMGLSIGTGLNIADGFGVLALASAFPVITMLGYGLVIQAQQRKSIEDDTNEDNNE